MREGARFDLISIGECLVEFNREESGRGREGNSEIHYRVAWAGDAVNALFYAARLGLRTGFVSAFGDDLFTSMLRNGIAEEGIDLSLTDVLPGKENGLYFIDLDERGEYTFHFRRKDSAATETLLRLSRDRLFDYLSRSSWVLFSGITLAVMKEPDRLTALLQQLRSTPSVDTRIAFDTNYRPALWPSPEVYRRQIAAVLPFVDLFLPSESDLQALWPDEDPKSLLASFPVERIAMKRGEKGCLLRWEGEQLELPVEQRRAVIDATGAGDAFNAGLIAGLVRGKTPVEGARLAMRVAGHVVSVRGAIDPQFGETTSDEF